MARVSSLSASFRTSQDPLYSRELSPTVQGVFDLLRSEILNGVLPAGDVVSQVKLSQRLGVNRAPVREALRMLQREGLIHSEHNRRVRVASLSSADMEQIYAVRIVQETVALRLSAPHLVQSDLDRLYVLIDQMKKLAAELDRDIAHFSEWERVHEEFHSTLISYAGDRIRAAAMDLMDYTARYRRAYKELRMDSVLANQQHSAIVRACEDGAVVEASHILARHLARTALGLIAATDPTYDPISVRESLRMVAGD